MLTITDSVCKSAEGPIGLYQKIIWNFDLSLTIDHNDENERLGHSQSARPQVWMNVYLESKKYLRSMVLKLASPSASEPTL
jgi:hypothetical protein